LPSPVEHPVMKMVLSVVMLSPPFFDE
jgi:hypothetical protein